MCCRGQDERGVSERPRRKSANRFLTVLNFPERQLITKCVWYIYCILVYADPTLYLALLDPFRSPLRPLRKTLLLAWSLPPRFLLSPAVCTYSTFYSKDGQDRQALQGRRTSQPRAGEKGKSALVRRTYDPAACSLQLILSGRYAGRKAVVIRQSDEGTKVHLTSCWGNLCS